MKKFLAFVFVLFFAAAACAEVRDFTKAKVRAEVPEGWMANDNSTEQNGVTTSMVMIASPDGQNAFVITRCPKVMMETFMNNMSKIEGVSDLKKISDTECSYKMNDIPAKVILNDDNGNTITYSISGTDSNLEKIKGSIEKY